MPRTLQLTAEDMTDLAAGNTINVEDDSGYELIVGADKPSDPFNPIMSDLETEEGADKFLFVSLFRDIAAAEAPAGSQVDDVLEKYQSAFDRLTGHVTDPKAVQET